MQLLRPLSIALISAAFVAVGVLHFVRAEFFISIMPPYLPWHRELVYVSGLLEMLGGLALLPRVTRRWAGWGLIALMIAVYPANIHMAMNPDQFPDLSPAALYLRLPLQFVMIAFVWWAAVKKT